MDRKKLAEALKKELYDFHKRHCGVKLSLDKKSYVPKKQSYNIKQLLEDIPFIVNHINIPTEDVDKVAINAILVTIENSTIGDVKSVIDDIRQEYKIYRRPSK